MIITETICDNCGRGNLLIVYGMSDHPELPKGWGYRKKFHTPTLIYCDLCAPDYADSQTIRTMEFHPNRKHHMS